MNGVLQALRQRPSRVAVACAAGFVVLTVLVASGSTDDLDVATRDLWRPDDEWGRAQASTSPVMDLLQPVHMFVVLAIVGVVLAIRVRSPRPLVFTGVVAVVATGATLLAKVLVDRPDPHQDMSGTGGAYPSGHMMALVVCLGTIALLVRGGARVWSWLAWSLVAVAGSVMVVALLLSATHWLTDVLGGVLVGGAVLCWARGLWLGRPASHAVSPRVRPGAG